MLSAISGVVVFIVSLAWVHDVDAPLVPLVFFALLCFLLVHPRIFGPLMKRLTRPFGLDADRAAPVLADGEAARLLLRHLADRRARALLPDPQRRRHPGLATIPFLGGTAAIGAIVSVLVVFAPSGLGVREASMYGLLTAVTTSSAALGATILNRLAITLVEVALFAVGIAMWRLRERRATADRPAPATAVDRPGA